MRYFGGKTRIAKDLAVQIRKHRLPGSTYLEPFVGGGSVFCLIEGPKIGMDIVPELIDLWKALQNGWEPPKNVTKQQYLKAQEGRITGAERAFIGFGCSFGGKWFGGYAQSKNRNYALNAYNSLKKKSKGIENATFEVGDFFDLRVRGMTIYCDPPYQGMTKPGVRNNFDFHRFWAYTRVLAATNKVLISELEAPEDFTCIWSRDVKTDMQSVNRKRIERLFMKT